MVKRRQRKQEIENSRQYADADARSKRSMMVA
jgi:hypothetical protein